jgi:hypothetical protein
VGKEFEFERMTALNVSIFVRPCGLTDDHQGRKVLPPFLGLKCTYKSTQCDKSDRHRVAGKLKFCSYI